MPAACSGRRAERIRYGDIVLTGATLRSLRERAGLTQAEVARAAHLPASVVSAYECDRRQPAAPTAAKIIEAIGFRIEFVRSRVLDPARQGRRLVEVLTLAETLPYRPRPPATARR